MQARGSLLIIVIFAATWAAVPVASQPPTCESYFHIAGGPAEVSEEQSAATFDIRRDNDLCEVSVRVVAAAGTADAGFNNNCGGADFIGWIQELTFQVGVVLRSVSVTMCSDSIYEPDETMELSINCVNLSHCIPVTPSSATLTITSDDACHSVFGMRSSTLTVQEDVVLAPVVIDRWGDTDCETHVDYTTGTFAGTATPGDDFYANTDTVVFEVGQTSVPAYLNVIDDGTVESAETVIVSLQQPSAGSTIDTNWLKTTVTIEDDDTASSTSSSTGSSSTQPPPSGCAAVFALGAASYQVDEDGAALVIPVQRAGETTCEATVGFTTYQATGTALAGTDYVGNSGTLVFPAGVVTRSVTLAALDDDVAEGVETLYLDIGWTSAGAVVADPDQALIEILDDEVATGPPPSGSATQSASTGATSTTGGASPGAANKTGGSPPSGGASGPSSGTRSAPTGSGTDELMPEGVPDETGAGGMPGWLPWVLAAALGGVVIGLLVRRSRSKP